ncbi:MAG: response regulator [Bacteroidetes bacterium]|nr:response regulator [Bacteroidota bacterium]
MNDFPLFSGQKKNSEPTVLIVDDSRLIRSLLRVVLEKEFRVIEADNGAKGLMMALQEVPEIIITDLMMPELDGYQMVRSIRNDEKAAHIPVIMLTTVDTEFNELEGYRSGVDAYLLKPFTKEQLEVRIENLIRNRNLCFSKMQKLTSMSFTAMDSEMNFGDRLIYHLNKEFDNPNLKVKNLSDALSMSVSTFERRIKDLYDTTPKLFIRNYRMEQAIEMLREGHMNVSGVARACGFENISYFSLCFREKFGYSPSRVNSLAVANA